MADSRCFERACEVLESETSLDRLQARGTVRLALKAAGLESRHVTPEQLRVVVEKLLPGELEARGIANSDGLCAALREKLATMDATDVANAPEAVFARLGGG
jgi:hypothetical protein